MFKVKVKYLSHFDSQLGLPQYQTTGAAGADIRASLPEKSAINITPGERKLIPTGICLEIPVGVEVQVRPRSGLSLKTGLIIPNSPGTIDSDYRGELKVIFANLGPKTETIKHGDRIAQIVLSRVEQMKFECTTELTETSRDAGGFGSTGEN